MSTTPFSVSASDRRIVEEGRDIPGSANTRYHTSRPNVPTPTPATASGPNTSGYQSYTGRSGGGQTAKTPSGWLDAIKPQAVKATSLKAFSDSTPDYQFKGGGAVSAGTGQVGTSDWGINDAALAQVDLIKLWGQESMEAAGEGEIARGMGRSGAYDAALATEMDRSRLEATSQMANAAAEQGRLNQQVALQNGQTATQVALANQQALLQADEIQSGYSQFLKSFGLDAWQANADTRLDYLGFDEGRRQFNSDLAFRQTGQNRDYQMDRLGYNEDIRQFNTSSALARYQAEQESRLGWADLNEGSRQYNTTANNESQRWLLEMQAKQDQESLSGPSYADTLSRERFDYQRENDMRKSYLDYTKFLAPDDEKFMTFDQFKRVYG